MTIEEKYAQTLFDNLNGWQDRTLARIGRRLKATGRLSAYDQKALKNIVDITGDMNAIYEDLARVTGQNIKEVQTAFERFMSDNMALYKPLYDFRKIPFVPYSENLYAQRMVAHWVQQTAGEMINLSRTKALSVVKYGLRNGERVPIGVESLQGAYQSAIDRAVFNVTSGVGDFYSNMRDTIEDLGGSGVRIDYGNGVTRSIDSVIRQNMLFAVKQMQTDYDNQVRQELGCDGFEVNFSATCRPSHAFMEGRMFSYNGAKTIDGVTYPDGAEALERLNDYNCHHRKMAVILGVSEPRYNAAEIAEKNRKTSEVIEYDGKKKSRYEWIQKQREIEREVRKQKTTANMAKAAGDKQLVKDCNTRIKALKAKYNDLTESVGLQKTEERMRVTKSLTNSAESSKIKEKIRDKKITKITDSTINKIPNVQSVIYSKDETNIINSQHKKLLKLSMQNGNSEVAFLLNNKLEKIGEFIGNETEVDLGNSVYGKGKNLFVMHNHPRNSGFSLSDIQTFLSVDNIKTISIVKNNGGVELITKGKTYSKKDSYIELKRNIKKYVKDQTDDLQYSKAIEKFLAKTQKERNGIEWLKI
nr:MAG TPA: minor capsid protein [Caudoviricetes sp.]